VGRAPLWELKRSPQLAVRRAALRSAGKAASRLGEGMREKMKRRERRKGRGLGNGAFDASGIDAPAIVPGQRVQ